MTICKYCGDEIINGKTKQICESKACHNLYMKEYFLKNPDKADANRMAQSKRNIQNARKGRYYGDNIRDFNHGYNSNPTHENVICEECGYEFHHQYKMESIWRNGMMIQENIVKDNVTPWGAAVCPKCGLISQNISTDFSFDKVRPANEDDYRSFKENLSQIERVPIIKRQAVYIDDQKIQIDFLTELQVIRAMLNKTKKRRKETIVLTTPEEEAFCFKITLECIKNRKHPEIVKYIT